MVFSNAVNGPLGLATFHASLLRPHIPNDDRRFPGRDLSQITDLGDESEWAVDRITEHHGSGHTAMFHLLWKSGDSSWLPYQDVKHLEQLSAYFEALGVADIEQLPSRLPPQDADIDPQIFHGFCGVRVHCSAGSRIYKARHLPLQAPQCFAMPSTGIPHLGGYGDWTHGQLTDFSRFAARLSGSRRVDPADAPVGYHDWVVYEHAHGHPVPHTPLFLRHLRTAVNTFDNYGLEVRPSENTTTFAGPDRSPAPPAFQASQVEHNARQSRQSDRNTRRDQPNKRATDYNPYARPSPANKKHMGPQIFQVDAASLETMVSSVFTKLTQASALPLALPVATSSPGASGSSPAKTPKQAKKSKRALDATVKSVEDISLGTPEPPSAAMEVDVDPSNDAHTTETHENANE